LLGLLCSVALIGAACGGDFSPADRVDDRASASTPAARGEPVGRPGLGFRPYYDADVEGCMVDVVTEGGPAAAAGIQEDDVIIELGDLVVFDVRSYAEALDQLTIGQRVTVKLRRGDMTVQLEAIVGRSMR